MALYKCILLLSFLIPLTLSCLQCDTDLRTMLWQIERDFIPPLIKESCLKTRARNVVNGMRHSFFADYAYNEYLGYIDVLEYENAVTIAKKKLQDLRKNPPAGKAFLDTLVKYRATFLRLLKKGLKKYKSKACSPKKCGVFKEKVLDCARCTKVAPRCFTQNHCNVISVVQRNRKVLKRARLGKGGKRSQEETSFFGGDQQIFKVPVENTAEEKENMEEEYNWFLIVGLVTVGISGLLLLTGMVVGAAKCRLFAKCLICKLSPNAAKKRKVSIKVYDASV